MNIDIKKIKHSISNNIIFISIMLVLSEILYFILKGINMLFSNSSNSMNYDKHTEVEYKNDDDYLGV